MNNVSIDKKVSVNPQMKFHNQSYVYCNKRVDELLLCVRFQDIVNCFISEKFQDIVNCFPVSAFRLKLLHTSSRKERAVWMTNRNFDEGGKPSACTYRVLRTRSSSRRFSGAELG